MSVVTLMLKFCEGQTGQARQAISGIQRHV